MLFPFFGIAVGFGDHLETGMADRVVGVLPEAADALRHVGETVLGVGFPQPVRGDRREIAEPRLAFAERLRHLAKLGRLPLQPART